MIQMTSILWMAMTLTIAFLLHQQKTTTEAFVVSSKSRIQPGNNKNTRSQRNSIRNNDNTQCEDNVLLLPLLEAELTKLKGDLGDSKDNNYDDDDQARSIQDLQEKIDNAKTAAEFGVRRVQAEFYDAFSNCDLQKMKSVWSDSDDVYCVHPGMERLEGSNAVMQSWEQIFVGYSNKSDEDDDDEAFGIVPSNVRVDICGRTAICACVEETGGGRLEALNIYRREGGAWKMVNHMASPTMMRFRT